MRTTIAVLLLVLLPTAAHAAKKCVPNTLNTGTVKIEVDPATGYAVPDVCRVKSGTVVRWKSKNSFQTKFADSPDPNNAKVFPSHQKLLHQEAEMTARSVEQSTTYPYIVETQQAKADPSVIIDP